MTVVAANVSLPRTDGVALRRRGDAPPSSRPPRRAAFAAADVLLMAAAVADFRPAAPADDKIKKDGPRRPVARARADRRTCSPRCRRERRDGQVLVGFAAEHGDGAVATRAAKLERKGLDAVVVNDISRPDIGFDSAENEVTIVTARRRPGGAARARRRRWRRRSWTPIEELRATARQT